MTSPWKDCALSLNFAILPVDKYRLSKTPETNGYLYEKQQVNNYIVMRNTAFPTRDRTYTITYVPSNNCPDQGLINTEFMQ
jgi:hypothetical protein